MRTLRVLSLVVLAAAMLPGQLQLSAVVNGQERPVGTIYSLGTVAVDATLEAQFRIRNTGASLATIQTLAISGAGFSLNQEPTPPMALLANQSVDFFVRFRSSQPTTEAIGTLRLNAASVALLASTTGTAGARLYVVEDDGSRTLRATTQTTVFPSIERGTTAMRRFVVENPGATALTVAPLAISEDSFQFASTQPATLQLAARETKTFEVVFKPLSSGLKRATFDLGAAKYPLEGVAREPVFPKPLLTLERMALESAKVSKIVVRFDAVSRAEGTGELRIEFRPSAGTRDDAAIQFVPEGRRTITFPVKQGQSQAPEMTFQTGTTAGSIKFTVSMGGWTAETTATVEGSSVRVDTGRFIRGTDLLDVTLTGFDNTRSVTEVAFTFYDESGGAIAPGAIRANVESRFKDFFDASTAGGLFSLRASFPVTGPVSLIKSMEAEFRNRAGTQKTQRFSF